MYIYSMFSSSV